MKNLKRRVNIFGTAIVVTCIIALSFTVIKQQQQIQELDIKVYMCQGNSMGLLRAFIKCKVLLQRGCH